MKQLNSFLSSNEQLVLTRSQMKKIIGGTQCSVTCADGRDARHDCGKNVSCMSYAESRTVKCGAGEVGYPQGTTHSPCNKNTEQKS